ncbi:unnamed protein product [[Candida] boidinii]|uniref:Unnamed protein product n=1 Tax=Candida boidinii TaxID=5477 RepID=A0A9W6SUX4_CANBO|nr:hypothetical protein B5S30_g5396 [[Candida] boidinii]OWB86764.1 hypothetical protein B5S33_g5476 [[Candida] boidinii]GME67670.1 unnamed protein product [[Candida] boidinii]GME92151.1 unnamed protein product [[Candida] boidinii]GMF99080.1 unnamed protein product [[Candida] boidinii]
MDPFYDVYEDGINQLNILKITSTNSLDYANYKNEIAEIIHDLYDAIKSIKDSKIRSNSGISNDFFQNINFEELKSRESKLKDLVNDFNNLLKVNNESNPLDDNPIQLELLSDNSNLIPPKSNKEYRDNPFSDSNAIAIDDSEQQKHDSRSDVEREVNEQYTQQLLQQQDDLINNDLLNSINTLHNQANTIGVELDHQSSLLNDVERGITNLNDKIINNGMKRINKFLATNERGGNCCIAILITVLVVILVLLIIL